MLVELKYNNNRFSLTFSMRSVTAHHKADSGQNTAQSPEPHSCYHPTTAPAKIHDNPVRKVWGTVQNLKRYALRKRGLFGSVGQQVNKNK